jgi:hypothetical protein
MHLFLKTTTIQLLNSEYYQELKFWIWKCKTYKRQLEYFGYTFHRYLYKLELDDKEFYYLSFDDFEDVLYDHLQRIYTLRDIFSYWKSMKN